MGAKLAGGTTCNIEVQNVMDTQFLKRVRYNLAMMETRALKKGKKYREIPLSFVVVLSPHDPFGKGSGMYHGNQTVSETDGEMPRIGGIIFLNGKYKGDDEELRLVHASVARMPRRWSILSLGKQ